MQNRAFVIPAAAPVALRVGLVLALASGVAGCCFGGLPQSTGTGTGTGTGTTPPPPPPPLPVGGGAMVTLGPGFAPDPTTATGVAGGPVEASTRGPMCRGVIPAIPQHTLTTTAPIPNLRILAAANGGTDITLVVVLSNGQVLCDDDGAGSLQPAVQGAFPAGTHQVFVGAYSSTGIGTPYTAGFTTRFDVVPATINPAVGVMGMPPPVAMGGPFPQECGFAPDRAFYGTLHVGSAVTIGRHTPYTGMGANGQLVTADDNWAPEMDSWVGTHSVVTELAGVDDAGCPGVRVAADNGSWFWRIRNLQP